MSCKNCKCNHEVIDESIAINQAAVRAGRDIRIAFATRQFEVYKLRALKAHAEGKLEVMNNFIIHMSEAIDIIDNDMRLNAQEQ